MEVGLARRQHPATAPTGDGSTGVYTDLRVLLGYRQRVRDLELFARRPARQASAGATRSRSRGRGMEFEETRLYQPGDDVRAIDWRVSARTGKAHTKLFREERERPVHILVDQRSAMFFGSGRRFKSVLAAELAALIAWAALAGADRIGGQVVGDHGAFDTRARRNRGAILRLLHDLHACNHQLPGDGAPGESSLAHMLEQCGRLARPGTAVFIIGDLHDLDTAAERALVLLGRHVDITLLRVVDALERTPPERGRLAISNGRDRTAIWMAPGVLAAYRAETERYDAALARACARSGARLLTADTRDEPLAFLRRHY
ncbi:MAG: DUF58 domain-containing protein [Gammaproteobacteria bacterium]|nr:DUF58 domain-containing protein [Gammaproteobacteria bacterium]